MKTLKTLFTGLFFTVFFNSNAQWTGLGTNSVKLTPETANAGIGGEPLPEAKLHLSKSTTQLTDPVYGLHSITENSNNSTIGSGGALRSPLYGIYSNNTNKSYSALYGTYLKNTQSNSTSSSGNNTIPLYGVYSDNSHTSYNGTIYGFFANNTGNNYNGSAYGFYAKNNISHAGGGTTCGFYAVNDAIQPNPGGGTENIYGFQAKNTGSSNTGVSSSPTVSLYGAHLSNTRNSGGKGDVYGIHSTNTNNAAAGSVYGAYFSANRGTTTNANDLVYGIYSSVTGGNSDNRWAGYFTGGNVAVMNGNVGIGTATPAAQLDVSGTTQTGKLLINHPNNMNDWNALWQSGFYDAENAGNAPGQGWFWGLNMGHVSNNADYRYGGQIAIQNSPNVPTMYFRSTTQNGEGTWAKVLTNREPVISVENSTTEGGAIEIRNNSKTQSGTANLWKIWNMTGSYGNSLQFIAYENSGAGCGNAGALCHQRLVLMDNGNVGIGRTDPYYKLDVNGIIRAHQVKINTSAGADFVFYEDYNLRSLDEIHGFIQTNRHLPEIPSAADMIENGLDMGEFQIKLLQKIEELTLYIIAQDKRIKELEKNAK